jgi:probable rRNA maturation factor
VRRLNACWRGIDKPTNVLSFRAAPAERAADAPMLGDIALAYETLAREAEESGASLADHYRHLVAHGFLHLIGYDHQTDEEADRMEELETRILAKLGVADPYAEGVVER